MRRNLSDFSVLALLVMSVFCMPVIAAKQKTVPMVVVGTAKEATVIDEVPLSGTVVSPRLAKLSTEVSGLVKSIQVDIGSRVKKGEVLLVLDDELGKLELEAARARNEQAVQALADAKRRLDDAQRLVKRKTLSENDLRTIEAEVKIDEAAMHGTQAEQQRQQVRLDKHQLVAPYSGVISRKLVEQGEWVQPGDAVLELLSTESMYIDFQLPQSVYPQVTLDTDIQIKLEAIPGKSFKGKIQAIVPMSDAGSRTLLLRAALQESAEIAHGMSASAILRLPSSGRGVVVERDAILRYPDGRITVWVVNGEGESATVDEVPVKLGLAFDGKVSVLRGLKAGMRVVLEGNEALRSGQNVSIHSTR